MTREEALEAIKAKMDYYESDKRLRGALETLIPELAESEDERIRREIIDFIQWAEDRGMTRHDFHQAKRPAVWIAYLENQKRSFRQIHDSIMWDSGLRTGIELGKQKEQKSLNISAASEWLRKHVCIYMNSEYNEFHKCIEYDGSIDKERLINDFEEAMQKRQKPVTKINGEPISAENQSVDIPLVELSEKEIEHLYTLASYIKSSGYEDDGEFLEGVADKLKSLRPSWKPSEEQMKALRECSECKRCIKELYEDLQKRYGTC